jgi:hypothetical protein
MRSSGKAGFPVTCSSASHLGWGFYRKPDFSGTTETRLFSESGNYFTGPRPRLGFGEYRACSLSRRPPLSPWAIPEKFCSGIP